MTDWTAGVVHLGPPARERHNQPLHTLTLRRDTTTVHRNHYVSARDAFDERVRRLRDNHIEHDADRGGLTIRYVDHDDTIVTLTYRDTDYAGQALTHLGSNEC